MIHDRTLDTVEPDTNLPERLPLRLSVSGLYTTRALIPRIAQGHDDLNTPIAPGKIPPAILPRLLNEELRLDVDRWYPQMTASGTIPITAVERLTWIASLQQINKSEYRGGIWYTHPTTSSFAYKEVHIQVQAAVLGGTHTATVTFTGTGLRDRIQAFAFSSPYFHRVEIELDHVEGVDPVTVVNTGAHPNHPATLPVEDLGIDTVFRRAGIDAVWSPNANPVPLTNAGTNATWSDSELNDAMVTYWSRFANKKQWALWTFLANRHDMGPSLGGIMFDDIGPNERQGTAIFYNSFISDPPGATDPNPAAYIARNRFWTTVHETGHCFNLAHSWQKSLATPWIPLADEPEARSFMNYPYRVTNGQAAFFADFAYRFSNGELLFMRHAPADFVEMGAAAWFSQHGFRQALTQEDPPFTLELRANRGEPVFEFLEPIVIELKLKNTTNQPQLVDSHLLESLDRIVIALKRDGAEARRYVPFANRCYQPDNRVLMPNEAMYASVFVWAGRNGVDLGEPGRYVLQAGLQLDEGMVVSNRLPVRVAVPNSRAEEHLAQDFLTKDVGRVLAFDGSHEMRQAVDTLQEVSERLHERRVARHARVALGCVAMRPFKSLILPTTAAGIGEARIQALPVKADEAKEVLTSALLHGPDIAAESLGHIDYKYYVDALSDFLAANGEKKEAMQVQQQLQRTLSARGVIETVLRDVDRRRESYKDRAAVAGQ